MYLNNTSCCAVDEIDGLAHAGTPRQAMQDFCERLHINRPYEPERDYNGQFRSSYDYYDRAETKPAAFYIFTGVEKVDEGGNRVATGYGSKFAAYIKEQGLGSVTESVARKNRVNHPDHTVKVWVWAPSEQGLKEWYKTNFATKKK